MLRGSFMLRPLESVLGALHPIPQDFRLFLSSWVSADQCLYFNVELQKLVTEQAARNKPGNTANITEEMLFGTGYFAD